MPVGHGEQGGEAQAQLKAALDAIAAAEAELTGGATVPQTPEPSAAPEASAGTATA
mgnify:CR=1 FL=1